MQRRPMLTLTLPKGIQSPIFSSSSSSPPASYTSSVHSRSPPVSNSSSHAVDNGNRVHYPKAHHAQRDSPCNSVDNPLSANNNNGTSSTPCSPEGLLPLSPPILSSSVGNKCQQPSAAEPCLLLADRYLILEPLEGNTLRKCIDTYTKEDLACKIVKTGDEASALVDAHQRLIECPQVTKIREVIFTPTLTYVLFPKSFGDLHSHVREQRRLRETEARHLFRQIVTAVASCHVNGVVLADLKLRRFVFADEEKTVLRLESLENAVLIEDGASDATEWKRHGYPAYLPPEVLGCNRSQGSLSTPAYSGKSADIWAVGIMLYTMMVGRYPFHDNSPLGLLSKILRGQYVLPDFLSSRAKCIIRNMLRRNPQERLCADDILHHPWFFATLRTEKADQYRSKTDATPSPIVATHDQVVPDLEPLRKKAKIPGPLDED